MSDYTIRTDVKYEPLERFDVGALQRSLDPWFNQTLCRVNDMVMRLGVVEGEFHWHKHNEDDEFFYVIEGRLIVDVEGRDSVELIPGQAYVVPKGIVHRTRAPERTAMLMAASAEVRPTGD
jgi:mannose-6-phosphate isomerase-like protein (cupin superfamily)